MLIAFSGLPGIGKSTLAQALSRDLGACYLRIDTIEQAIRDAGIAADPGPAGYLAGYALAESNLRLGRTVVADSANILTVTRNAWRDVAGAAGAPLVEVELVCSDAAEHRRRLATRPDDIAGLARLSWQQILDRPVDPWDRPHLTLDTAGRTVADVLADLRAKVGPA
jgi:predicted kinase